MRIFYTLSLILLLSINAKSQDRRPQQSEREPVAKVVRFYPNPATSLITFDFQQSDEKAQLNLQIFNLTGKKVHEVNKITPKTIVDVNDYYRGIYIFQLRDKNGKVIDSGKFQVAH